MKVPVLFIPGLLCDAALWRYQVKVLADVADSRVADTTGHDRIDSIARDVLAKAPPQFGLVGLSMGGYVALEIMRQAPERVLKLCLLDTQARPDTEEQQKRRRLLIVMSQEGKFKGVTPRLMPLLIHPDRLKDVDITDVIMAMAERVGRDAFQRQQTAILNRVDSRPFLGDIKCPTTIIGGREDAITPPDVMRELHEGIPQSQFHIIENCGHLSPLEQPEQVNMLMRRWLAG